MTYKPFIFKLNNINISDIFDNTNVIKSSNINQPLFSLGFHSFIHRTKSAMAITEKLETKNKFYYVVNPFEHNINDYNEDIQNISNTFLNNPEILSRDFYKMWEILYYFDIASSANKEGITMVSLAEEQGSFIQAFVEFREKFFDASKDTIYSLTINTDNINTEMVENINKRYDNMISVLKTSATKSSSKTTKTLSSNRDLTKTETIDYLKVNIKKNADLIIADGSFEWKNKNYQEQEAYALILGEIIGAISIQAKGGSFVLKVFETFTHTTIKLVYLLSSFYEECYIYKPFFSRDTNSEKYIICKGFKHNEVDNNKMKKLLECLKHTNTTSQFINDIFPKFILKDEDVNIFKYININIANTQQIMINNLIVYIKSNNYFGDMYHNYRDLQIKANKWWINTFFTDKLNEKNTMIRDIIKYNDSEINLFVKKLI